MGSPPRQFTYTVEQVAALERTISPERLAPYVIAAGGDKVAALRLYEQQHGAVRIALWPAAGIGGRTPQHYARHAQGCPGA